MRKLALLLLLPALALADAISLALDTRFEFVDCPAAGSAAQTVKTGTYLFRITDETTFVCFAASGSTCGTGGEKFPAGMAMIFNVTNDKVSVSCRSPAGAGDVIFTRSY